MSTTTSSKQGTRWKHSRSSNHSTHSFGKNGMSTATVPTNGQELVKLLESLSNDLNSQREWEDRVRALRTLTFTVQTLYATRHEEMTQTSRPMFDILIDNLRMFRVGLKDAVTDLRSAVVREACDTLKELAVTAKSALAESLAETLFPCLIRIAPVTIAVIAESGAETAKVFVKYIQSIRMVRAVAEAVTTQGLAPAARSLLAEVILLMLENQKTSDIEKCIESFEKAILAGVQDAAANVRAIHRKNFWTFASLFPHHAKKMAKSLESSILKNLGDDRPENAPNMASILSDDNNSVSNQPQLRSFRKSISITSAWGKKFSGSVCNDMVGVEESSSYSSEQGMESNSKKEKKSLCLDKNVIESTPKRCDVMHAKSIGSHSKNDAFKQMHQPSRATESGMKKKKKPSMRKSDIGKLPQRVAVFTENLTTADQQNDSFQKRDEMKDMTVDNDTANSIVPSMTSETGRQQPSLLSNKENHSLSVGLQADTLRGICSRKRPSEADWKRMLGKITSTTDWRTKVSLLTAMKDDIVRYVLIRRERNEKLFLPNEEEEPSKTPDKWIEEGALFPENSLSLLLQHLTTFIGESHAKVAVASLQLLSQIFQTFETEYSTSNVPTKEQLKLAQLLEKEGLLIRRLFQRLGDSNSFLRSSCATAIESMGKAIPWTHLRTSIYSNLDSSPRVILYALSHLRHSFQNLKEQQAPNVLMSSTAFIRDTTDSISITKNIAEPGSSPINRLATNFDASEFVQMIVSYVAPLAHDKNADIRRAASEVLLGLDGLVDIATLYTAMNNLEDGKYTNLLEKLGLFSYNDDSYQVDKPLEEKDKMSHEQEEIQKSASPIETPIGFHQHLLLTTDRPLEPTCIETNETSPMTATGKVEEQTAYHLSHVQEEAIESSTAIPIATNQHLLLTTDRHLEPTCVETKETIPTGAVETAQEPLSLWMTEKEQAIDHLNTQFGKVTICSVQNNSPKETKNVSNIIANLILEASQKSRFVYLSKVRDILRQYSCELDVTQVKNILEIFLSIQLEEEENIAPSTDTNYCLSWKDEMKWITEILVDELWKQTDPIILLSILEYYTSPQLFGDFTGDWHRVYSNTYIKILLKGIEYLFTYCCNDKNCTLLNQMKEKDICSILIPFLLQCVKHEEMNIRKAAMKCLTTTRCLRDNGMSSDVLLNQLNETQINLVKLFIGASPFTSSDK
eukprot:jgi/Galph1/2425/GphlegSOOS_G1124.1